MTVSYNVTIGGDVQLRVYGVTANVVKHLSRQTQAGGGYSVVWDGRDDNGKAVASGLYIIVLSQPSGNRLVKVLAVEQ